jgi:hypothetical protein
VYETPFGRARRGAVASWQRLGSGLVHRLYVRGSAPDAAGVSPRKGGGLLDAPSGWLVGAKRQ